MNVLEGVGRVRGVRCPACEAAHGPCSAMVVEGPPGIMPVMCCVECCPQEEQHVICCPLEVGE